MQQIINSQERTQAYFKFLLFFLITVGVVVLAVFFDFYMPSKENKLLKDEVYVQRRQEANQQKFVDKMMRAVSLIDSMDKSTKDALQLRPQVEALIQDMTILKENSGALYGQLNNVVVKQMNDLLYQKKLTSSMDERINKYKEDLESCKSQAQQLQSQLGALPRN
jgi:hypothetical protein